MTTAPVSLLLAQIEEGQAALRHLLRSVPKKRLAQRPRSGGWSCIENVRHLLFHEQGLERMLAPDGFTYSPFGLPPPGLAGSPRVGATGTKPTTDIDVALRAWAGVHASVRRRCPKARPSPELEKALQKNLRHLNTHVKIIERLLREISRESQAARTA